MNSDDLQLHRLLLTMQRDIEELQRLGPPRVFEGIVTTTDATPTLSYRFGTGGNVCYQFIVQVVGRRTDVAGETASYQRTIHAKSVGGVLTIGATTSISTFEDAAAWDVTVTASGVNIDVNVVGEAGKTISWKLRAHLDQV